MSRQKNPDRGAVTSTEGPALTIRFSDAEYAGLKMLVDQQREKFDELGLSGSPSLAGTMKLLLRNELKSKGVWSEATRTTPEPSAVGTQSVPAQQAASAPAEVQRDTLAKAGLKPEAIEAAMQAQSKVKARATITNDEIRDLLVAAIRDGKLVQKAVADELGVGTSYISHWKGAKPKPISDGKRPAVEAILKRSGLL